MPMRNLSMRCQPRSPQHPLRRIQKEIEEDPKILEDDLSKATKEPLDLIMEDGAMAVSGELPYEVG